MLCKREILHNIPGLMGSNFWIEPKIDGERIQIHYKEGVFKYFSRYTNTTLFLIKRFNIYVGMG
jgi:ATP-dependent DNA ligase